MKGFGAQHYCGPPRTDVAMLRMHLILLARRGPGCPMWQLSPLLTVALKSISSTKALLGGVPYSLATLECLGLSLHPPGFPKSISSRRRLGLPSDNIMPVEALALQGSSPLSRAASLRSGPHQLPPNPPDPPTPQLPPFPPPPQEYCALDGLRVQCSECFATE